MLHHPGPALKRHAVDFPGISWTRDDYVISTDPARLDLDVIHGFLAASYWSEGIPRATVERAVRHSICFGLLSPKGEQAGFARVVSDRAIAALLCDVFVLEPHRGRGLGAWLVECALAHPELQNLRRWRLATADAHGLYSRFGFKQLTTTEPHMAIERPAAEVWAGARPD